MTDLMLRAAALKIAKNRCEKEAVKNLYAALKQAQDYLMRPTQDDGPRNPEDVTHANVVIVTRRAGLRRVLRGDCAMVVYGEVARTWPWGNPPVCPERGR